MTFQDDHVNFEIERAMTAGTASTYPIPLDTRQCTFEPQDAEPQSDKSRRLLEMTMYQSELRDSESPRSKGYGIRYKN